MATPLLLLVHGRSGGAIPAELTALAADLEDRRAAPVLLQALTAAAPPALPASLSGSPLTLVPLLLLPGTHVRLDLPAVAAHWRRQGPLRRLSFLGAWDVWQQALADEVAALQALSRLPIAKSAADGAGGSTVSAEHRSGPLGFPGSANLPAIPIPVLLHHPLEGALAQRYLNHLGHRCGARCVAAPYSSAENEEPPLAIDGPALPLALAANRLTETGGGLYGPPLLARERCRSALVKALEALP
jgi:hypothetical protein